jgi:hypothetical protein
MNRNAIRRASLAGLSLALAAGAYAAPTPTHTPGTPVLVAADTAPAAQPGAEQKAGPQGGHFSHGLRADRQQERGGVMIPGLGPLSKAQLDGLKLNDSQQQLLGQARDAQRDLFKSRFQAKNHELLDKQLAAGKLDPHALVTESDARREQFEAQAKMVRDKWLAVWDSLNDAQRTQVTGIVKTHQSEMKARHEKMRERMQEHRQERSTPRAAPPQPGA